MITSTMVFSNHIIGTTKYLDDQHDILVTSYYNCQTYNNTTDDKNYYMISEKSD